MFRTLLLVLFSFCLQQLHSQVWIDAGVKGSYGLTMLYNANIFNDGYYNYQLNSGYGFGAKLGINFAQSNGIALEGMRAYSQQSWEYDNVLFPGEYSNSVKWDNWDLYLLYRFYSERAYIELGPKYSLRKNITQTDSGLPIDIDVNNFYEEQYPSATLGFGGFLAGSESFALILGFRLDYAVTDFISESGQNFNYPNPVRSNIYSDYKGTHPLSAQVSLELNFAIGEYAKASCGKRAFLFFPGNR